MEKTIDVGKIIMEFNKILLEDKRKKCKCLCHSKKWIGKKCSGCFLNH